ncbi:hypothetical protein [Paenibacillus sp. FJAT-27812]|nr:hypothetical protein [Paenibacillus sp. FJAT-27812]
MSIHFPWVSSVLIQWPWALPITMVAAALLLSLISWFKPRKK